MSIDVLTITPNPSLDLLHETDRIVRDDANRVDPPRRRPGGQGINVARAVLCLGGTVHAVAPLGGRTGDEIQAALEAEGVPLTRVEGPGETRIFPAIRERETGGSILINPRGVHHTPDDVDSLFDAAIDSIDTLEPRWVACCGSLPPGFPVDFYVRIGSHARARGARFVADCDGEPLRYATSAGVDLLVPNRFEAERLTGSTIDSVTSAAEIARTLTNRSAMVVITLGADGAVMACGDYCGHATCPAPDGSAVGAGDSLLAAVLLEMIREGACDEVLRSGVAAGAAVLAATGSDLIDAAAFHRMRTMVAIRTMNR